MTCFWTCTCGEVFGSINDLDHCTHGIDTSEAAFIRAYNEGRHADFIEMTKARRIALGRAFGGALFDRRDEAQRDYEEEADAHGVTVGELLK